MVSAGHTANNRPNQSVSRGEFHRKVLGFRRHSNSGSEGLDEDAEEDYVVEKVRFSWQTI